MSTSASSAKPKKSKTTFDMIVHAIRNQPTNANGVSRMAITKYLKSEFQCEKTTLIKNALKTAIKKGKIIQNGQSFRMAGDPVPERPVEPEVTIEDVKVGPAGPGAEAGDTVVVKYEGKLDDGTVFDAANKFEFVLGAGEVIKGWDQGVASMRVGGTRKL
eukprot:CAMPEP_0197256336 /NCGR_PEP_ID=MMETSP1429-20130617/75045_1 /TAXON_ID=49237 /ORGANISM="Chaetoceros  sp., Strain UNC1202" /LENGTH=159 /DNA_ID=CAMNT_0042719865 /DNA_START=57 /DNA_END=533 /DNA_ORIENTATION=+